MDDAAGSEASGDSRVPSWAVLPPALLAAATVAAVLGLGRRPSFNAWWQVPVTAAFWVLLTCAAAALMVYLVRRFTRPAAARKGHLAAIRPVVATVAWFVPVAVFLRFHLAGAAIFAAIAGVSVVRLWREIAGSATPANGGTLDAGTPVRKEMFLFPPPVSLLHQFVPSLIVATLLQSSFVAYHWKRGPMMIALISIALSSVAWMLSRGMPAPRRRYEIATAIAVLMAAIGLIPFVVLPHARSPWPFASTSPDPNAKIRNTEVVRDSHAGVILVADTKLRVTKLVAPTPASWRAPATTHLTEPLEIPFDGVYWFYRPPAIRPPQRSVILHGQPDIESFRSPDYYPMVMEGRQNLGRPLDLSCCSEIRVSIRNADRYPGSVEMELRLINTLADGRPSLSLGREQVTTVVPTIAGKATPQREQLTFQIPTPAPITRFDELHVRFHMHRRRSYRSAKIAIDRFVLEPRRL